MEACLSIKFAYLDWLTCKKCLLGGHGNARRTLIKGLEDVQLDNIHLSALVQLGIDNVKHLDQLPIILSPGHRFYLLPGKQRFN